MERLDRLAGRRMKLACGDATTEVRLEGETAVLDGRPVPFTAVWAGGRLEAIRMGRDVIPVRAVRDGNRVLVWCAGAVLEMRQSAGRAAKTGESSGDLSSPMPGRVRRVVLEAGAKVARGDVILILEAMKMEHAIRAPREGTLARVFFNEGDLVEAGVVLAELSD